MGIFAIENFNPDKPFADEETILVYARAQYDDGLDG